MLVQLLLVFIGCIGMRMFGFNNFPLLNENSYIHGVLKIKKKYFVNVRDF